MESITYFWPCKDEITLDNDNCKLTINFFIINNKFILQNLLLY